MTYDVGVMGNGALAGLVAITAGCSVVYPWGAIAIGFVAGFAYVAGSRVSILLRVRPPSLSSFSLWQILAHLIDIVPK